ncbi:MAG: AAA-like domain-containing protein [Bacillota bacterium]
MERFFNAEGPIQPDIHYYVPMLERFHSHQITALIEQRKYFLMHAARQTGKTSCLLAYMRYLNAQGKYKCLYVNIEGAQSAREDIGYAMKAICERMASRAQSMLGDDLPARLLTSGAVNLDSPASALEELLSKWAAGSDKPLVLLIDEADALIGDALISLLRQLRAGYDLRPQNFPQSVLLCGVRDIKDYRIHGTKEIITGGSAFNIKAESLTMSNFSEAEVRFLYQQHTITTGQQFEDAIYAQVMEYTGGQPWLVNALAYDICFREEVGRNRSTLITTQMFADAKERLIYSRRTHIDQLIDKLKEPRVQRVIEPILAGEVETANFLPDDIEYVAAMGLIEQKIGGELIIPNQIYREVIPRELAWIIQPTILQQAVWYIDERGALLMEKMLIAFQDFFRENSEIWLKKTEYTEYAPQIILQAFLQRVVNGGGEINREYALGSRRLDLLVKWKLPDATIQKEVIELKILRGNMTRTLAEALPQTADYMDKSGVSHGNLLIFDRTPGKTWDEKVFIREETVNGKVITVYGM